MVLLVPLALALLLLVVAVVYDVIAKRRGTYRSASEWSDISKRRKEHNRTVREARRARGTEGPDRR